MQKAARPGTNKVIKMKSKICVKLENTNDGASELIKNIEKKGRTFFSGSRGSHDWDHTQRVFQLCKKVGDAEDADMTVLLIAALLHDIGRGDQDNSNGVLCHAKKGAEMATPIVEQLPLSADQKENIIHSIRTHRFRNNQIPKTREAKVLFDADKLDAIGAVGVARAFLFAGEVGARLHSPDKMIEDTKPYSEDDTGYREYKVKLSKIKDRMLTITGKGLANERHAYMENFFKQFLNEYEGKG